MSVERYWSVNYRQHDWCQLNDIGQLIIGKNPGWKQSINIGQKNNQALTNIPHAKLISLLTYKAQLVGIVVTLTEESYTSKASALDGDNLPRYNKKTEIKPVQHKYSEKSNSRLHEGNRGIAVYSCSFRTVD
ncbi:MAG: IS200/IS605 family accessory protein TnpB-related protein [Microcoleus sp. PH2017_06_SFM_O_A]|nr:IS200/IS605 family accessory protein TnpB-related protein [Microcoleus sp. PH2017_06_SFM_O_A]